MCMVRYHKDLTIFAFCFSYKMHQIHWIHYSYVNMLSREFGVRVATFNLRFWQNLPFILNYCELLRFSLEYVIINEKNSSLHLLLTFQFYGSNKKVAWNIFSNNMIELTVSYPLKTSEKYTWFCEVFMGLKTGTLWLDLSTRTLIRDYF